MSDGMFPSVLYTEKQKPYKIRDLLVATESVTSSKGIGQALSDF